MTEALIAVVAGLLGALIGLAGTMLNLRHQRALEREKWIRQESVDAIAIFTSQLNEVWRSTVSGGQPLDAADGPWVECANAYDRATMVIADPEILRHIDELWEAALEIRWEQPEVAIWDDEVWPLMHSLKAQVRRSLGTLSSAGSDERRWRPPRSRHPDKDGN